MGGILDSLTGGGDTSLELGNIPIVTFQGGGLTGEFAKGGDEQGAATVTSSRARKRLVRRVSRGFRREARNLGKIKRKFGPAFQVLRRRIRTQSRLQQGRTVSNLRENLARRRILGSSFASDAIGRTEAEFATQRGQALAAAKLQELDIFTQLTQAQAAANRAASQTRLNELNLQASLANQMRADIQAAFSQGQAAQQALAFRGLEGLGSAIGSLPTFFSQIKDLFGPAATAAAASGSSRAFKENNEEARDVLEGLESLTVESWTYKPEMRWGTERHIGPYAEDFREIFGVGDGKTIHLSDGMGIFIKAVQELASRNRALEREIEELKKWHSEQS